MSQADEDELELDPAEETALLEALEAALRPSELDPSVQERLLEWALEDPLAPPSEQERIEAERLRDALEKGSPNADADFLRALTASSPSGAVEANEQAIARALGPALPPLKATAGAPRRNVVYAIFGAGTALVAAAAAIALLVGTSREGAAPASAYVTPHSTAPLFADRFETGDTTARMDLIAGARSRDLRNNRYASWGVR